MTDQILFGYKAPALHDPDHLRLELLSRLLIGGPSSPIYRDLVIEREIFSSLGGSVTPFVIRACGKSQHRCIGDSADEGLSQFDAHAKVVAQGPSQARSGSGAGADADELLFVAQDRARQGVIAWGVADNAWRLPRVVAGAGHFALDFCR